MGRARRVVLAGLVPAALVLFPGALGAVDSIFSDGFESGETDLWSPDEPQLRALIAGAAPDSEAVVAALETIGRSFGLPVRTRAGTYLFAADCGSEAFELAGDFNAWTPEPMTQHGALCWLEKVIGPADGSEYLFHVDTPLDFADPRARRYRYEGSDEVSLVRSSAAHLERWFGFGPEEGLASRPIDVWVPAGHAFDRILFLQDGQNLFDPNAFFGGWDLQSALPAGVLAVGIHNTPDRCAEYTRTYDANLMCGGSGAAYGALLNGTVRPFVEARYGSVAIHGLLGSSLGGVAALSIALQYPGAYDFAASMSGSLWWDEDELVSAYNSAGHGTTAIYLDSGGGGPCPGGSDNYCVTIQMRDVLLGDGYVLDDDLWYVWDPGAPTNETAWSARVATPLGHFADL